MTQPNPAIAQILQWFDHEHLSPTLQEVAAPIASLAHEMERMGTGPELTAGLRKLLEAKDCFVRSAIAKKRASGE